MEGTARVWFTAKQKAELWERWKNGQCVADIARALGRRNKSGVYRILALDGGIAPIPRRRAVAALRLEEREEISRGIAAGRSVRWIARDLGRSPSTVSMEIRRNEGRGRGPCRSRSLGRRPSLWSGQHAYCDTCRAPFSLCDAAQGAEQGYRDRSGRAR
jgi:DNA-binding CsgD family transcriptional regulator